MIVEHGSSGIEAAVARQCHCDGLRRALFRLIAVQSQPLECLGYAFRQRNGLLSQNSSVCQHPADSNILRKRCCWFDMIIEHGSSGIEAAVTGQRYCDGLRRALFRLIAIKCQSLECLGYTFRQCNSLLSQNSSVCQHPTDSDILRKRCCRDNMVIEHRCSGIQAPITGQCHRDGFRRALFRLIAIKCHSLEGLRYTFCQGNGLFSQNSSVCQHPAYGHILHERRSFRLRSSICRYIQRIGIHWIAVRIKSCQIDCLLQIH